MISVILPTYNRRALLMRALRSVLDQTHADLECIVVDDGSTDGTEAAVRALSDPRIRYVHQENAGACAARNHGVDLAQGAYIAFQDSDDVWHAEKLEKQLALLKKTGADAVACAMRRDGNVFPTHVPEGPVAFDGLLKSNLCSTQCLLGRAEVFREVRFDPQMPRLQDWDLLLRLTEKYRLHFHPEPLVDVYVQSDSISCQPEKLHRAFCLLYRKFHGAISAPERQGMALHWLRSIRRAAPEGMDPWPQELLALSPAWVCREAPEGEVTLHFSGAPRKETSGGTHLYLNIEAFHPGGDGFFLPESLLESVLQRASRVYAGGQEGLPGLLNGMVALKGRRAAWDALSAAYGGGAVAAELSAQCLTELPAWAEALQGIVLPERTGPVRRIAVYYHSLRGGGVQRVAAAQLRLFADMGYPVTLITASEPTGEDYPLPAGVQRVVIPAMDPASPDANRAHTLGLHGAAKDADLLVYHAWADALLLYDVLAVRLADCRCLIHTHSVFTLPLMEGSIRDRFAALPRAYAFASGVAALSRADAAYWLHAHPRVYTVTNPLTFDPASTPVSALSGKTILWAGRLSKEKQPLDAVEIFARVARQAADVRLLLVGGGDEAMMASLRARIAAHGLTDRVELPGFQQDMRPWYGRATLFLCTSAYEGFCLTMAEAQTCGVPCVTYDMPWLTILQGGGHVSVPQGDLDAAAAAIVRLLNDGPCRAALGKAARENIETNLNIDQRAQWAGIFADLAAPTPAFPAPDDEDAMLAVLRTHAASCEPGQGSVRPTIFMPLPEHGPCKQLRRKAAMALQMLLIDGPRALWRGVSPRFSANRVRR